MKLRVNFVDDWGAMQSMQFTSGCPVQPSRRMVEIELTPEQVEAITRKHVGSSSGNKVFESIESMYFTEATDE